VSPHADWVCWTGQQPSLQRAGVDALVMALRALDFHDLACEEQRVAELTRSGAWVGDVYATTKELPVWKDSLPLAQNPRANDRQACGAFHRAAARRLAAALGPRPPLRLRAAGVWCSPAAQVPARAR
jgi:hypothetical protein